MNYEVITRPGYTVSGLPLVTTNEPGRADVEIGALWGRFFEENVMDEIPQRMSEELVGLYTDYEGDHTQPYTLVVGAKVDPSVEEAPAGLVLKRVPSTSYALFNVEGEFPTALIRAWQTVWNSTLPRAYSHDMEVYPNGFPMTGEVDMQLYIALGEDVS